MHLSHEDLDGIARLEKVGDLSGRFVGQATAVGVSIHQGKDVLSELGVFLLDHGILLVHLETRLGGVEVRSIFHGQTGTAFLGDGVGWHTHETNIVRRCFGWHRVGLIAIEGLGCERVVEEAFLRRGC